MGDRPIFWVRLVLSNDAKFLQAAIGPPEGHRVSKGDNISSGRGGSDLSGANAFGEKALSPTSVTRFGWGEIGRSGNWVSDAVSALSSLVKATLNLKLREVCLDVPVDWHRVSMPENDPRWYVRLPAFFRSS